MAYGQKNYPNIKQGINGKYTIAQIGCFLTAFCNLLDRFGMPVDPPTLNNIFIQRGIFIDIDDGVRDDLGWQSVTAYNGQVVTTVKSGSVTVKNAIVRLSASNSFGTHFCLVDSIRADGVYIVDSWDGQVKHHNVYGPITGWAAYTYNKPQPVGVVDMIPDQDNYYWRYNKAMQNIRGRQMSRDEFRKNFVGRSHLTMLEAMLDDPEADKATDFQQWALANRVSITKQVTDQATQIKDLQTKLSTLTAEVKALTDTVTSKNAEIVEKNKEIESLKAQVGDNSKWETLKALIRELIGK